jgi:hypothetical protein
MARYFLTLHECGTVLDDPDGQEWPSLEAVLSHAVVSARDVMMGEVRAGRLCLACFIVITDVEGKEVGRVNFAEAVTVTGA